MWILLRPAALASNSSLHTTSICGDPKFYFDEVSQYCETKFLEPNCETSSILLKTYEFRKANKENFTHIPIIVNPNAQKVYFCLGNQPCFFLSLTSAKLPGWMVFCEVLSQIELVRFKKIEDFSFIWSGVFLLMILFGLDLYSADPPNH